LSVEADQLRSIREGETALAVRPIGVEGAEVSGVAGVVTIAGVDRPETFEAASIASAL
jgi:hypothetical protein